MSDRELLEAAARAAGYEPIRWGDDYPDGLLLAGEQETWNPITDDGDALRLAVTLGLQVFCPDAEPTAVVRWYPWDDAHRIAEIDTFDRNAATRRCIVRAAAAIGAEMMEKQT